MQEKSKLNKTLIKVIIAFVASLLSMVLSITATLAWASKNMETSDEGLSLSLSPDLMDAFTNSGKFVIITGGESEELTSSPKNSFLPGSSEDVYVGMYNKSKATVSITSLGLEKPSVWIDGTAPEAYDKNQTNYTTDGKTKYDEMPVYYNSTYYYFGQNIKLSVIQYEIYDAEIDESKDQINLINKISSNVITGTAKYILPTDLSSAARVELLSSTDITNGQISLEIEQAVLFKLHIEFVNIADADQSMFMGFGNTTVGGYCHRSIYASFKQTIEE